MPTLPAINSTTLAAVGRATSRAAAVGRAIATAAAATMTNAGGGGDGIDLSQDDYYRLYSAADEDDSGDADGGAAAATDELAGDEAGNFLVSFWNPFGANNGSSSSNNAGQMNLTGGSPPLPTITATATTLTTTTARTTTTLEVVGDLVASDSGSGGGINSNNNNNNDTYDLFSYFASEEAAGDSIADNYAHLDEGSAAAAEAAGEAITTTTNPFELFSDWSIGGEGGSGSAAVGSNMAEASSSQSSLESLLRADGTAEGGETTVTELATEAVTRLLQVPPHRTSTPLRRLGHVGQTILDAVGGGLRRVNGTTRRPLRPFRGGGGGGQPDVAGNDVRDDDDDGGPHNDIALIDSAESDLDLDAEDYGAALGGAADGGGRAFNAAAAAGGSAAAAAEAADDFIHQTLAYDEHAFATGRNESFHHSFDGGGGGGGGGSGGAPAGEKTDDSGGSTFMLLLEDFGEYFYNYNGSGGGGAAVSGTTVTTTITSSNLTELDYRTINCTITGAMANNLTAASSSCFDQSVVDHNYWALILILFPILTLFGNILVILSVCRERSLQTVTNYFIVSLAIADLLVAVVVMPFAVYVLFNGIWALPNFVCDFYIAMDVICSTSSIFNLVAISIDRYIAVTQPIKYAKHKNSRRVCLTILLVWAISAAIGSPIVLGLNNTPNRDPDLCVFYNTDFILYSSLSSFYIPCIIMVFLYWNIFKALRSRARKQRAARKPHLSELTGGSVIENIAQTRRLAETALDNARQHTSRIVPDEAATNTGSGSQEEDEENAISPDIDDCHVIVNDKSTEFMLATVVEETGNVVAQITTQPQLMVADPNGNHDSGYAPSNVDDVLAGAAIDSTPPDSPERPSGTLKRSNNRRTAADVDSPKREPALSVAMKPLSFVRYGVQEAMTLARNDSTLSTTSKTSSRKDKKNSQASRFTIYKVHKASKKKREKSSAKKERKATKTLAIVLGVFLFCWVPFFTCNIMDAMCSKFDKDCRPGVTAFMLTTWLGYINSFVNPVIYTIFNPEFRKAFKKIMHMG